MRIVQCSTWAAVVWALTVGLSAQELLPSGQVTPPDFGARKTVTVTGCLERAKLDSATTNDRTAFMLNNVVPDASDTRTAGTSGSETTPKAVSYRLDGEDSKLSGHVGHKVEITGTLEDRPMGNPSTPTTAGSPPEARKFKVESVKMIASSCTDQ